MSNMQITFADMQDAAARLRVGQDEMNTKLTELGSLIDSLTGAGFKTDQASVAYNETFDQFSTGLKQAIDALDGLAMYLEQAASAYETTDTDLSNQIRG